MKNYIDLHTHSHYSDGTMSPYELVALAKRCGLKAVSLTDHDTSDGIKEFMKAGKEFGIETIPGIEFSCISTGETHILGYNMDTDNADFVNSIETAKKLRRENNIRTQDALKSLGFDVTVEEVRKISPVGNLGRAHFARVMADKGYVSSPKEAFDLYLKKGKPAFNSLRLLEPEDAIRIIKNAGGTAFLAHLHLTKMQGQELEEYLVRLKNAGLDGIEGYYSEYTDEMQKEYQALAEKHNLLLSGGTDFHGANKPHIALGTGYGNLKIPYELVKNLKQH